MKGSFSSVIMDFIKFWTFTTSQCLSAKQYFPTPDEKEQQDHLSKFNPLLAFGVRILMAHTLPWVFCAALFLFMWQYLVLMPCFSCINFSISVSRAQHYSCFRKQEKTLSEVIQLWPQSRVDLNFLNPNPEVGCISDRKIYPWADSVTWDVNQRLAPNCDEESGHLPFGFLWCWIAYLQALLQSQESWSGNWKEKYSNW